VLARTRPIESPARAIGGRPARDPVDLASRAARPFPSARAPGIPAPAGECAQMSLEADRHRSIAALRRAIPYLRLFQGKVFVIKAGGEVFQAQNGLRQLLEQVGILHQLGIRSVVVHGGGAQATALADRLGLETRFVEGRRVTDEAMLSVTTMVLNGSINTSLVATCRSLGVPALGLSGVDAGFIRARRRPPRRLESGESVDYGFVGDIVSVDVAVIQKLHGEGFLPIVSPISADDQGVLLNINADVVAAHLAKELKAEKLIFVASVPGILRDVKDPSSLISYVDVKGLNELQEAGLIKDGMLPKVASIKDALYGGVHRVHVISHKVQDSLLTEIFTNEGSGTLVVLDTRELAPEETAAGSHIAAILRSAEGPRR
jgi:acetylglutamate kinase